MHFKLLFVFFLIFVDSSSAQGTKLEGYGEFMVRQAWEKMFFELNTYEFGNREYRLDQSEYQMMYQLFRAYGSIFKNVKFEFRPGTDPVFVLNPGEPPRSAVTGSSLGSPIIFNLDRINSPENFHYSHAVQLLMHELGHKIRKSSQLDLDKLAAKIQTALEARELSQSFTFKGETYILSITNVYGRIRREAQERGQGELFPAAYIWSKNGFLDISSRLHQPFLEINADKSQDLIVRYIIVEDLQIKDVDGAPELRIKINHVADKKSTLLRYEAVDKKELVVQLASDPNSSSLYISKLKTLEDHPIGPAFKLQLYLDDDSIKRGELKLKGSLRLNDANAVWSPQHQSSIVIELNGERMVLPILFPWTESGWEKDSNGFVFDVNKTVKFNPNLKNKLNVIGVLTHYYYLSGGPINYNTNLQLVLPEQSLEIDLNPAEGSNRGKELYIKKMERVVDDNVQPSGNNKVISLILGMNKVRISFSGDSTDLKKADKIELNLLFNQLDESNRVKAQKTFKYVLNKDQFSLFSPTELDINIELMSRKYAFQNILYGYPEFYRVDVQEIKAYQLDEILYREAWQSGPGFYISTSSGLTKKEIADAVDARFKLIDYGVSTKCGKLF